jgi:hypothetical protein
MGMANPVYYTADTVRALPGDTNRYEAVYGVLGSRGDISWGPDVLVSPDVFVVPVEEARTC